MKAKVICTTLLVEKSPQALPLGAACIASAIKHNPLTKDFCDAEVTAFSIEDSDFAAAENKGDFIAQKLLKLQPKAVCFSVYVWNRLVLEAAAAILKNNGIKVLAGGPEVTAHPEVFAAFDEVCTGEGEIKVPAQIARLLGLAEAAAGSDSAASSKTPAATLAAKAAASSETPAAPSSASAPSAATSAPSVRSSVPAALPDLNLLSSPYLDGTIDPSEYGGALWELARGCPFKCSYCYESKGSKTVRLFPMERITKELELFAKKKIPQVFVLDPTYNANKNRALELLKLIAQKTPDTFYYFEARAEFIDPQLAKAFTKIPCAVQIGLQSADEEVLKLVHRPFNKKIFTRNIGYLNDAGVIFGFDLIFGLPGETLKGFKESIDFALSLYPNNLELFCLSVLPGTDIFDRAEELHLTFDKNPPYHVIHTDKYSEADIAHAAKLSTACTLFYNQGRAVPWFNTICRAAHLRPSAFLQSFSDYIEKSQLASSILSAKNKDTTQTAAGTLQNNVVSHKEIERLQKDFVSSLLRQKNLQRLEKAALDLIAFNGALSRTQDCGQNETIQLNYDAEYLASEYSTDLQFFCQNVKPKPCSVQTFMNGSFADFRTLKKKH